MTDKSTKSEMRDSSVAASSLPIRDKPAAAKMKASKEAIADSWEDDSSASETDGPASNSVSESHDIHSVRTSTPDADIASPPRTPRQPDVIPFRGPKGEPLTGIAPPPNTPRRAASSTKETAPLFGPTGEPLSGIAPPPNSRVGTPGQRPEKTASTASRMIAGALGQRAPRRTEEQRAFDEAAREKLRRRREEDARRVEEERKVRESVWDG